MRREPAEGYRWGLSLTLTTARQVLLHRIATVAVVGVLGPTPCAMNTADVVFFFSRICGFFSPLCTDEVNVRRSRSAPVIRLRECQKEVSHEVGLVIHVPCLTKITSL